MIKLSISGARALLLTAQGMAERPAQPAQKDDVLGTIRRMGLLQIDTISVVARSPYLVLWSRLGTYEPRWLDELLAEGALFEYWAHAACFLPIEDYGLYRRRMLECAAGDGYGNGHDPEQAEVRDQVLAHIRERGAARSVHFTRADTKAGTWWDWKPEKIALERLFNAGVLMIARREGFQRVYDLQERVLPDWDDEQTSTREAGSRAFALKAVKALGVATAPWVVTYFKGYLQRRSGGAQMAVLLEDLAREGLLARVEVADWRMPAYVHPDNLPLAALAAADALPPTRTTFLSPFDPIVSNRDRIKTLFGFDYRIETYTPGPKRIYGYFSLPILHRNALVGRLDAKAHRRQGLFEVKVIHLEKDVPLTDELVAAVAATLRECAEWHKTPEVVIQRSEPPELAALLSPALP
ncbi:MAG: hypothetical protein JWL77_4149 [Chthonomonadaceae bacterium]|nr:hypothetical protein [Chthonomonadaceae bacterium]